MTRRQQIEKMEAIHKHMLTLNVYVSEQLDLYLKALDQFIVVANTKTEEESKDVPEQPK